ALDVAQPTSATILDERPGVPRRRRRRCSATNPGFRQQRSPPDMGLKGFTWVQNQFPKPDTSAGHIAVTAIPGPKPVSTSAILVALLFCQGEAGGQGLVSWSPALRFCGSALHYGFVYVAVVDLSSDAFAAALAGDFPGDRYAPVTAAPAGDVDTGEQGLDLHGVHCDQRADPVHVGRDDAVGARRRQDVVADHRVKPGAVAHVGVGVRVAQSLTQADQQR